MTDGEIRTVPRFCSRGGRDAAARRRRVVRTGRPLLLAAALVLTTGRCGPPPIERQAEQASVQRWDAEVWRAEVATQLQRVELHVPLLREIVQSGNPADRHVEIRRSHELLSGSERSIPHVPWGVMDETTALHRGYASAVTDLRWTAELLLWAIQPETPEQQRQSYLRDARYYLELGAQQLSETRAALLGNREHQPPLDPPDDGSVPPSGG